MHLRIRPFDRNRAVVVAEGGERMPIPVAADLLASACPILLHGDLDLDRALVQEEGVAERRHSEAVHYPGSFVDVDRKLLLEGDSGNVRACLPLRTFQRRESKR